MSKRIERLFSNLAKRQEKALITYLMAGDPDLNMSLALMDQLVCAGADILEVGFPFSEPMADGPIIQAASMRSLRQGTTLLDVLHLVHRFRQRQTETPIVLMGYLNPIMRLGETMFAQRAAQAGVDAVLVVDCPPESSLNLRAELSEWGIQSIYLIAPTTSIDRVKMIAACAQGFLYYVSLKGVTGATQLNLTDLAGHVRDVKRVSSLPVAVGFGIKTLDMAKQIACVADAVVVGSQLVEEIAAGGSDQLQRVERLTKDLKQAILEYR